MRVRLTKPWARYPAGHVFTEMPAGQARTLIARHFAEEVVDEPKPVASPMNRMAKPRAAKGPRDGA